MESRDESRSHGGAASTGLGAFGGVFTPSVLTILGIILFLRHGWVVGSAGLTRALGLILVAHSVSALTSLSLAAIATNRRVKGGGDYFLISRSLGPEFGGALGVVLFFAQSISIAFYCFGFGEAAAALFEEGSYADPRTLAVAAALLLFAIAIVGADLATRFQFLIMAVMTAALGSFFVGAFGHAEADVLRSSLAAPEGYPGFWVLFAIFFPAVTGFTQGVSMSGDLAEPSRSLPRGTFAAVAVSLVVYTAAAVLFAAASPLPELAEDYGAFRRLSIWPPLFTAGVIAATLSSALASFLGAPRILQALSRDGVFPWLAPLAVGSGPADNPRRAILVAGLVALVVFALGDLNAVAKVISMFFLVSYGLLNLATFVEARGASPRFRPRFRFFDARLSLLGTGLCAAAMVAIDVAAAVVAFLVVGGLYRYLRSKELAVSWSDSRPAFNFQRLKGTIREIDRLPLSDWDWQPNLLVFGENAERRDLLVHFATAFSGESGFTTSVGIIEGESDFAGTVKERAALEETLREEIESGGLDAFPLAVAAPDLRVAVSTLLQTWGIGPVRANSVVLDWWEHLPQNASSDGAVRYGRQLRALLRLGCHVLILDVGGKDFRELAQREPSERRIDVWWWEESSCRLSLLLAYLLTRSPDWEESTIRVLVPCRADEDQKVQAHLAGVLEVSRIDATVEVVPDASIDDLVERSADASMVLFRFGLEGMRATDPLGGSLEEILPRLPMVCIVGAAGTVRLTEPEPDDETAPEPSADSEDDLP